MTLPSPALVRQRLKETRALMEDSNLPTLYRTAHNFAYERVKVQNVQRRGSGPANPTRDAAVYEADRRRKIEVAWRKIDKACLQIEHARAILAASLPDEPHAAGDPDPLPDAGDKYRKEGQANQRKRAMFPWDPTSSEVV